MKTDTQLQRDVIAELGWEPSVHAAQIGVEVRDGVVTLSGTVSSFPEKWNAERATQRVNGVKALAVHLEVKLGQFGKRDDADIAESAQHALAWTTSVPDDAVQVMVEGGWLTLSGSVDWQFQKLAAAKAVRYLVGVNGVSDQIAIRPRATVGAVKSDIEAALARRASSDSKAIHVHVDGAQVTLTGTVHSFAERELATHTAWGAFGVTRVVDDLAIAY